MRFQNIFKRYFIFSLTIFWFTTSHGTQCFDYLNQVPDNELILVLDARKILDLDLFGNNRLALSYVSLAVEDRLLEQSDSRLFEEDLIVENGGLCGPVCLTNIYLSKNRMNKSGAFRYWFNYTQDLVREILDKYMWHTGAILKKELHDPRMGTFLNSYLDGENIVLESLGLSSTIIDTQDYDYDFSFLKTNNAVIVASVNFRSTNIPSQTNHALIILGVDNKSRKLIVSDPNHPNQILITPYKIENGELIFYLWNENYVEEGDTSSVVLQSTYYITVK